jgi:hypothetical protein
MMLLYVLYCSCISFKKYSADTFWLTLYFSDEWRQDRQMKGMEKKYGRKNTKK